LSRITNFRKYVPKFIFKANFFLENVSNFKIRKKKKFEGEKRGEGGKFFSKRTYDKFIVEITTIFSFWLKYAKGPRT
jgi:hypothetical protein